MAALSGVILLFTVIGGLACAAVLKPGREPFIHVVALSLLIVGAYLDSLATNLTRPPQMYVSQAMIATAGALFLPPAMATGLMSALKRGPHYILSFIIVFLTTQSIGGIFGSAIIGSFVTWREKIHSHALVERLTLTDPVVAKQVGQLTGAFGRVLTDKTLLNAEGLVLLAQQATREAYVLAYNDAFFLIATGSACALAALLIHIGIAAIARRLPPVSQPALSSSAAAS